MASYDNATYTIGTATERRGWCQEFPQFITGNNATLVNYGLPGRSSRDYYGDTSHHYWQTVKSALKPGDYVFIQFAHNDEVYDGLSSEEATAAGLTLAENAGTYGRGNEAWGTYHDYLVKYIEETRALGANPILVGPVVRLGNFPLSATNCHDLTGNGTVPGPNTTYQSADYVGAMKDVAMVENCPYIDLTASTKALVQSFNAIGASGLTDAKTFVYNDSDNTHLKAYGATLFAQLAAEEMVSKGLFAGDLNPSGVILSSTDADFGSVYVNTQANKIFSMHGLGLTPDSGTITITAPDPFTVSASAGRALYVQHPDPIYRRAAAANRSLCPIHVDGWRDFRRERDSGTSVGCSRDDRRYRDMHNRQQRQGYHRLFIREPRGRRYDQRSGQDNRRARAQWHELGIACGQYHAVCEGECNGQRRGPSQRHDAKQLHWPCRLHRDRRGWFLRQLHGNRDTRRAGNRHDVAVQ